jgi:hypothetical protein
MQALDIAAVRQRPELAQAFALLIGEAREPVSDVHLAGMIRRWPCHVHHRHAEHHDLLLKYYC